MKKYAKVAIVYDWFDKWGGVERVLLILNEMFPKAVFYTSVYDKKKATWAKNLNVRSSHMRNLPKFITGNRLLSLPFYLTAFESMDFINYDLVISVTSSFSKSAITHPSTKHICYLLTPTRFLWSHKKDYIKKNMISDLFVKHLRNWDYVAANRPDEIISISDTVRKRCIKYYGIKSNVIYPPFDIEYWKLIKSQIENKTYDLKHFKIDKLKNYFLIVSRLENYKKIDLAIDAFNKSKEKLIVVGEGSVKSYLENKANENILFLSEVSDHELGLLYSKARALIMMQEEDFGYVSLESQFFGTPVISYNKGGAVETIINNKTGMFFERQSAVSLNRTIERFKAMRYNLKTYIGRYGEDNLMRFSKNKFMKDFKKAL